MGALCSMIETGRPDSLQGHGISGNMISVKKSILKEVLSL